jgi:hypothetical protein
MKKLIALLLFFQITGFTQSTDQGALKRLLAKGGFSGELNGKVRLTQLGTIQCGQTGYAVIYYEWEESNPPGAAIHATQRVLFLGGDRHYVGSYSVDDRPLKIAPASILFDYLQALGNVIKCSRTQLPKTVLLNGEPRVLFK